MSQPVALLVAGLLVCGALVQGCTDPDARYAEFLERTEDMRGVHTPEDSGEPMDSERFDFSGSYVMALAATLSPDTPLLLALDADVEADLERFALTFQPLSTQDDDDPLTAVGPAFELQGVRYQEDGSFDSPLLAVTIPGRANPISGSEIVADVALIGRAFPADGELPQLLCGQVEGAVSEPLELDLEGSSFGAVAAEEFESVGMLDACP